MSLARLNEELNRNALMVCRELLPKGKLYGKEWKIGNFDNQESHDAGGGSASVCVNGPNVGKWQDFANPDDRGSNLVGLWCRVKHCDFKDAYQECAEFVHLDLNVQRVSKMMGRPSKAYTETPLQRPASVKLPKPGGPVQEFFRQRGIAEETIKKLQVGQELESTRFQPGKKNLAVVDSQKKSCAVIVFPYKDIHGELTFIKYRRVDDKQFTVEPNRKPILFGWQSIDFNEDYVIITEGEIDQMTLTQYGFNALSVPFGGGNGGKQEWIEHEYDNLQFFKQIYLALDNDTNGQTAMQDIARRLGSDFESNRFLTVRDMRLPYKDANECLLHGITREQMLEYFDAAEPLNFDHDAAICQLSDFRETLLSPKDSGLRGQYGATLPWSKLDNSFRLRPQEVTMWGGYSGHGKTHLLFHVMTHLMSQGERVLVASLEMVKATCGDYLVYQASGVANPANEYKDLIIDWFDDKLWLIDNAKLQNYQIDTILKQFTYCAKKFGISHFVLDCLSAMDYRSDDYDAQRNIIKQCKSFANRNNAHVHLVAHIRKNGNENEVPTKPDIKDSSAWTDLSDNVVMVWRNVPKEKAESDGHEYEGKIQCDTVLQVEKQRLTGNRPKVQLWAHRETGQWLQNDFDKPMRYVPFTGKVEEWVVHEDDNVVPFAAKAAACYGYDEEVI